MLLDSTCVKESIGCVLRVLLSAEINVKNSAFSGGPFVPIMQHTPSGQTYQICPEVSVRASPD